MVLIFDLDEDDHTPQGSSISSQHNPIVHLHHAKAATTVERPNPNLNGFSAALSCYPIVASLACHLDLNTLDNLSQACHQFRANLLPYRKQLIARSLRCSKEDSERNVSLADGLRQARTAWTTNGQLSNIGRITSGKVGKCARDQVAECRRGDVAEGCDIVVCRNCVAKPPSTPALRGRHRRLCKTCNRAPLALLTSPNPPSAVEATISPSSSPSTSPARIYRLPTPSTEEGKKQEVFAASAFIRDPCCCRERVWLCQPCGHALRAADTDYHRAWNWRGHYSTYLGGLGTGIGEGVEGVQCGRGHSCLAARIIEQEVDCDVEALQAMKEAEEKVASEGTGRSWQGTSFAIQEMEGVGGVVKKKVKKLLTVGAYVAECEDERDGKRSYLDRENQGEVRSWCAWCDRVIPSKKDLEKDEGTD